MKLIVAPALAYFACAFGAGFALGSVRVLWLAPQFGVRAAELAEAPLMLLVILLAARWVLRRFAVPPGRTLRLMLGIVALACLLVVEFTVVLWLQGISIRDSIVNRDPVSGAVYAMNLLLFALMPALLSLPRQSPSRAH